MTPTKNQNSTNAADAAAVVVVVEEDEENDHPQKQQQQQQQQQENKNGSGSGGGGGCIHENDIVIRDNMMRNHHLPIESEEIGLSVENPDEMYGLYFPPPRSRGCCCIFWYMVASLLILAIGVCVALLVVRQQQQTTLHHTEVAPPEPLELNSFMEHLRRKYNIVFTDDNNNDSPQYQAAVWMVDQDQLEWTLSLNIIDNNNDIDESDNQEVEYYRYRLLARYVMVLNYFAFNNNDWREEYRNIFLDPTKDICDWNGVLFNGAAAAAAAPAAEQQEGTTTTTTVGVTCSSNNNLPTSLVFSYNNEMKGTIPTENGLLTTLTTFDWQGNHQLYGSIPTELCQLTHLEHLLLGSNQLTGSIPYCISQMTRLQSLHLSYNRLYGTLPTSAMVELKTLHQLFLDHNQFSGNPIPLLWNRMTQLQYLVASHNQFTGDFRDIGTIPNMHDGESYNAFVWKVFDVSHNNFTIGNNSNDGNNDDESSELTFPVQLFNQQQFPNLEIMDVSVNSFSGARFPDGSTIPTTLNTRLKVLSVYQTQLQGTIPAETIDNLKSLQHLDLSNNAFTGPIPSTIGMLSELSLLFLSNNPMLDAGTIPSTFANLHQLVDLSLRNTNRMSGENDNDDSLSLPEWMSQLTNLVLLDLGDNVNLQGSIPESWGTQLSHLTFLLLQGNPNIHGPIPTSYTHWNQLASVFIDGTNITGDLSTTLCTLPHFQDEVGTPEEEDRTSELFADCDHDSTTTTTTSQPLVTCTCCHCCNPNNNNNNDDVSCSKPMLAQLDVTWENNYQRPHYRFTNSTTYAMEYIP